jgi:hypothetical protein
MVQAQRSNRFFSGATRNEIRVGVLLTPPVELESVPVRFVTVINKRKSSLAKMVRAAQRSASSRCGCQRRQGKERIASRDSYVLPPPTQNKHGKINVLA